MVLLFFASQFHYKGLTHCCGEGRKRRAAEPEQSKSVVCQYLVIIIARVLLEFLWRWMD